MKPIHLQVAACVVLIVPFVLISHLPNKNEFASADGEMGRMVARKSKTDHAFATRHIHGTEGTNISGSSSRVAAVLRDGHSAASMEPAPVYSHADPDESPSRAAAGCGLPFQPKHRLPAVQLAANAKFPAVFMARVSSQGNNHEAETLRSKQRARRSKENSIRNSPGTRRPLPWIRRMMVIPSSSVRGLF